MLSLVGENTDSPLLQREIELRKERFQLAKLLRITEEMLLHAQKGDWETVEEMEFSRKSEIDSCFTDCNMEGSPLVAEALATLIFLNKQISKLVVQARKDMLESRRSFLCGKGAVQDYQNNMNNG